MTKQDFLNNLKNRISQLPSSEIEKSLDYYSEMIDDRVEDGMTEEDAVNALGDINKIVESIEIEMPMSSLVKNKIKESHNKSNNKILWIILAILGSPFWIPIAFSLVLVVLSVYAVIWSLIIALYAILLALAVCGVACICAGVVHCFITSPVTGFMIFGVGIASFGLFLMSIKPIIFLTKKLCQLTVVFIKNVKGLFVSKKEVA